MDVEKIEEIIREIMQKRISDLSDAIAATEIFLAGCDEYQASCDGLQMLHQEEFDIRDAYLRVQARLLSLKARLSIYKEFDWLMGCESTLPYALDDLMAKLQKSLQEKENSVTFFERAVIEAKADECIGFDVDLNDVRKECDALRESMA